MKVDRRIVTRQIRRSRGRLTRAEALAVVMTLPKNTDFIAFRTPGAFARDWADPVGRAEWAKFTIEKFWHYGPRFGEWPGERRIIP